jgi:hypothetical protein
MVWNALTKCTGRIGVPNSKFLKWIENKHVNFNEKCCIKKMLHFF